MEDSPEIEIRRRVQKRGKITFAEFMELALFHPKGGYYTSPNRIGAAGDYFTSSLAHPAFGALLAMQLQQMWELVGRPSPFYVVEMGAGAGLLARDIMAYLQRLPEPFRRSVCYLTLERWATSPDPNIQRIITSAIPLRGVVGCALSNELVDSFPVHRFQIEGGHLKEIYVTLKEDTFDQVLDDPSTPLLEERLKSLGLSLQEGFRGEVNLAMGSWMADVSRVLKNGLVITIDYGYPAAELYSAKRAKGTLQCYYKHTQSGNPYVRIGRQDITAHVDFTSLAEEGKKYGLEPLGLVTQRELLNNLGMGAFLQALRSKGLPQRDYYANRMAMLELIKPEGLGNFKVLAQAKGVGEAEPHGLTPGNELIRQMEADPSRIDLPLLRPEHIPLMEGRYPHVAWELQEFSSGPDA